MKKGFLFVMLMLQIFTGCELFAQTGDTVTGINWTKGLSWDQIKQKAKTTMNRVSPSNV